VVGCIQSDVVSGYGVGLSRDGFVCVCGMCLRLHVLCVVFAVRVSLVWCFVVVCVCVRVCVQVCDENGV
jgi:hypothetical protein